jgi:hypothetical protein
MAFAVGPEGGKSKKSKSEAPLLEEDGRGTVTQAGNAETLKVDCNWMWWKTCWELYPGYMIVNEKDIYHNCEIVGDPVYFEEQTSDIKSRTVFIINE